MNRRTENEIEAFVEEADASKEISVTRIDPIVELRNDIFSFFRARMDRIKEQDKFKAKLQLSFEKLLEEGNLNFDQIVQLYRMISNESTSSSESIIGLFKPVPGAPSLLGENLSKKDDPDEQIKQVTTKLTPEKMQALDKLSKLLEMLDREDSPKGD